MGTHTLPNTAAEWCQLLQWQLHSLSTFLPCFLRHLCYDGMLPTVIVRLNEIGLAIFTNSSRRNIFVNKHPSCNKRYVSRLIRRVVQCHWSATKRQQKPLETERHCQSCCILQFVLTVCWFIRRTLVLAATTVRFPPLLGRIRMTPHWHHPRPPIQLAMRAWLAVCNDRVNE